MEDFAMIKKEYLEPMTKVVEIQYQNYILTGSLQGVNTSSLGDDDLDYDNSGGDQGYAW